MTAPKVRFITATAAIAAAGAVLFSTPAQAQEGYGVNSLGHICGQDVGPEPTCTYTTASASSYGGTGPFTILATNPDGSTAFSVSCAEGEFCSDQVGGTIPASTVTITVTGASGGVLAGSA